MNIISIDELASYLRDETVLESSAAVLIVDLANGIVEDTYGPIVEPPTRLRAITLEVAARAFRNPDGYSSETIDDYTYRRDTETRQAGVYLTPSERAEIVGMTAAVVGGGYTVNLGSAPWA